MNEKINIELIQSSKKIRLKDTPQFSVGVKISNTGSQKLGFTISETELWVNGKKNVAWDLAVQNGTLINLQIPAHSGKIVQWPLGEALFQKGGNYTLELRWRNIAKTGEVLVYE